jgi:hypothetical protein
LGAVVPASPGAGTDTGHTALELIASAVALAGLGLGGWLLVSKKSEGAFGVVQMRTRISNRGA